MDPKTSRNELVALGCVLLATLSRSALPLLGHSNNFSSVDSIALFSGALFGRKLLALVIPLLSIWISDMVVDLGIFHRFMWFYPGFYWQYAAYGIVVVLGILLSESLTSPNHGKMIFTILCSAIGSATIFFIVSNFGVWASFGLHPLYPHTASGLVSSYLMALPFFPHTLVSDLLYSSALFGCYQLIHYKVALPKHANS